MIEQVLSEIQQLFITVEEGDIHGYHHALRVYLHALEAIKEVRELWNLSPTIVMSIKLAALLHDVDDGKIFGPYHEQHLTHARQILDKVKFRDHELVLEMIRLVGFSHNGIRDFYRSDDPFIFKDGLRKTRRGTLHQIPKWKLIPRDCDRLEALGSIGVARCIGYGCQIYRPLFDSSRTPRLTDDWSILKKAVNYWLGRDTIPNSTIDYFIKGLVLRTIMSSKVKYLETLANQRRQPVLDIIKIYGKEGYLNKEMILKIVEGDECAVCIVNQIETITFSPFKVKKIRNSSKKWKRKVENRMGDSWMGTLIYEGETSNQEENLILQKN